MAAPRSRISICVDKREASRDGPWLAPVSTLVQRDIDEESTRSQMRIAFKNDTTATGTAAFSFANAAANRPSLEIEYWEP